MSQWDQRYGTDDYVYGTVPNDFLTSVVDRLPRGKALCLAEGEGRNAVYLAQRGFDVLAVDSSVVGLAKANNLARQRGVSIETRTLDLADLELLPDAWDVIVSIFCHVPTSVRAVLHGKIVRALRPGGMFVLEAYTPLQLNYKTGGPPTTDLLMTLESLREELAGLEFHHARELVRNVVEGKLHTGKGAVVQILASKRQKP